MTDLSDGSLDALRGNDVSIWLENISRDKLQDGSLAHLIATALVVGVTSNPTIFMQAIEKSNAYDRDLAYLARRQASRDEAARALTAADICSACDAFSTVFAASAGRDGRVSIEVDPRAADDAGRTVARGSRPMVAGQQTERRDQDPGNACRPAGHHPGDGRGHLREASP